MCNIVFWYIINERTLRTHPGFPPHMFVVRWSSLKRLGCVIATSRRRLLSKISTSYAGLLTFLVVFWSLCLAEVCTRPSNSVNRGRGRDWDHVVSTVLSHDDPAAGVDVSCGSR